MNLGRYDQKHDYPERDRQGSKPVGPAGKRQTRRIEGPLRYKSALKIRCYQWSMGTHPIACPNCAQLYEADAR